MAKLQGAGAMTGVNLIAQTYFNNVTTSGKAQFLDVQIDHRDQRGPGQTNLHLKSERQEDGRFNNGAAYTTDQFAKIRGAAGPNTEPILSQEGQEIGRSFAFKGSLMPTKDNKGLVVNTNKEMGHSDFKLDGNSIDGQYASMQAASEAAKAERAASVAPTETPSTEATAGVPAWATEQSAEQDQPALG